MTNDEMRVAIAKACGWERDGDWWRMKPTKDSEGGQHCSSYRQPPNYLSDLNAMHAAIATLPDGNSLHGRVVFVNKLMKVCGSLDNCIFSTAAQRAEAFLRTVGKWKEAE